jgi:hypothetical protein
MSGPPIRPRANRLARRMFRIANRDGVEQAVVIPAMRAFFLGNASRQTVHFALTNIFRTGDTVVGTRGVAQFIRRRIVSGPQAARWDYRGALTRVRLEACFAQVEDVRRGRSRGTVSIFPLWSPRSLEFL